MSPKKLRANHISQTNTSYLKMMNTGSTQKGILMSVIIVSVIVIVKYIYIDLIITLLCIQYYKHKPTHTQTHLSLKVVLHHLQYLNLNGSETICSVISSEWIKYVT